MSAPGVLSASEAAGVYKRRREQLRPTIDQLATSDDGHVSPSRSAWTGCHRGGSTSSPWARASRTMWCISASSASACRRSDESLCCHVSATLLFASLKICSMRYSAVCAPRSSPHMRVPVDNQNAWHQKNQNSNHTTFTYHYTIPLPKQSEFGQIPV